MNKNVCSASVNRPWSENRMTYSRVKNGKCKKVGTATYSIRDWAREGCDWPGKYAYLVVSTNTKKYINQGTNNDSFSLLFPAIKSAKHCRCEKFKSGNDTTKHQMKVIQLNLASISHHYWNEKRWEPYKRNPFKKTQYRDHQVYKGGGACGHFPNNSRCYLDKRVKWKMVRLLKLIFIFHKSASPHYPTNHNLRTSLSYFTSCTNPLGTISIGLQQQNNPTRTRLSITALNPNPSSTQETQCDWTPTYHEKRK